MGQLFVTEQRMCFRFSGTALISYNEILFKKGNSFIEYTTKHLIFMIFVRLFIQKAFKNQKKKFPGYILECPAAKYDYCTCILPT